MGNIPHRTGEARNRIPSTSANSLFDGLANVGAITLEAHSLGFAPETLPILHPHEQLVLAAITKWRAPRRLLEIGTGQGRSTRVLAANSPADAVIVTVDLPTAKRGEYSRSCLHGDAEVGLVFAGTPDAAKIHQVFCDSRQIDPLAFKAEHGPMDLILIDGDHGYEAVRADTALALTLAHADTVLLWHDFYTFPDYIAEGPVRRGVHPALNELAEEGQVTLRHIIGTYYVVGCPAWSQELPGTVVQTGTGPFATGIVRLDATARSGNRDEGT